MAQINVSVGLSPQRWDAYVNSRPAATGYHLSAWATVFNKAFGHETRYLAAEAGGEIVGILPLVIFKTPFLRRFSVSLPFVNYGGIVADSPEAERALIEAAIAETRAVRGEYLELRHTRQALSIVSVQAAQGRDDPAARGERRAAVDGARSKDSKPGT